MSPSSSAHELGPAIDGERRHWPLGEAGRMCLYVADRRRGRPVVLVHDLRHTSSAYEMRPLFECLRWRRPTYAIDLPGFGLSDRAPLPYGPALFAAALGGFARKLRRRDGPVDLVALGRGAEVVARLARDEPGLVRSLVLLEPWGLVARRRAELETLVARVSRLLGERAARGLFALVTTRPFLRYALSLRLCTGPDEAFVAYAHASARLPDAWRAPVAAAASGAPEAESALLYRTLALPILVVHDARAAPALELEHFLRGRSNRFAVRISPTRGMPHFEKRVETAAAMDRFWQALTGAAWDQAMR